MYHVGCWVPQIKINVIHTKNRKLKNEWQLQQKWLNVKLFDWWNSIIFKKISVTEHFISAPSLNLAIPPGTLPHRLAPPTCGALGWQCGQRLVDIYLFIIVYERVMVVMNTLLYISKRRKGLHMIFKRFFSYIYIFFL